MPTVKFEAPEAIAAYRAAYYQANGVTPPWRIEYERGFIEFIPQHGSTVVARRRLADLKEMTARLKERAGIPVRRVPTSEREG